MDARLRGGRLCCGRYEDRERAFDWPHQVLRIVTVLLILGAPVVVTLAWYHGHRALRRVAGLGLTIIAVLLVIAAGVFGILLASPQETSAAKVRRRINISVAATPAVAISDKSIAVLPFVDMSEKHDQEYFSDGLSEELIDHLAHTRISRSLRGRLPSRSKARMRT